MALTSQQLTALKNAIVADPVLNAQPLNSDGAFAIQAAMNTPASPSFTMWKMLVPLNAVGMAIDFSTLAGLTTANTTRLQTMFQISPQGINAYLADRRAAFDDIFSAAAGAGTRAALLALWKRLATRAEKLFATSGSGTDADPGVPGFEGSITINDVMTARSLP